MKYRFLKNKIVASIILVVTACCAYYASTQYWLENYELYAKVARDQFRSPELSDDIVVVGIDLKSYRSNSQWPWPRSDHAKIVRKLNEAGVSRIFFDLIFNKPSEPAEDEALAAALNESKAKIFMPVNFSTDENGEFHSISAEAKYLTNAQEVSIAVWYNGSGQVFQVPYRFKAADKDLPTMASVIAGRDGAPMELYPVDYAFDWKKVKSISAIDLLNGSADTRSLRGKTIVYGFYTKEFGDTYIEPGGSHMPGMAIQVISANLLSKAKPTVLDPWVPLLVALSISLLIIWYCRSNLLIWLSLANIPAFFICSTILESRYIYMENMPAFLVLFTVVLVARGMAFASKFAQSRRKNNESGLENKIAFTEDLAHPEKHTIVVVRFDDYQNWLATLSEQQLVDLVAAIGKRISPLSDKCYQGVDGTFYFGLPTRDENIVKGALDGSHAMFLNPIAIDDHSILIKHSIGYDMEFDVPISQRISNATLAAFHAHEIGQNHSRFFASYLDENQFRVSMYESIKDAMRHREIVLFVQPKVDLQTGIVKSGEGLVRWMHSTRGMVSPYEFMPVIEKTPLIAEFTLYVIELAIETLRPIIAVVPDFKIAINVPPALLSDEEFLEQAFQRISDSEFTNDHFVFEITERGVLFDKRAAGDAMQRFVDTGIKLSIDDFGTANSNIEILRALPAAELKIDQSFVKNLANSLQDRALIESIIAMAHNLGYTVVAEGVETAENVKVLRELGCDLAQGYFYAKPLIGSDFTRFLIRNVMHQSGKQPRKYG